MKDDKCPRCPDCGMPLILSISTTGVWNRKINKDGNLHQAIYKSFGIPQGVSFLNCSSGCGFIYSTEPILGDERFPELDAWIEEHIDALVWD